MKIDYLKINGFGKLENKNIDFDDKINVVFGENESGKSSVLKFIASMLYGASKNKNGKDVSDFDKFKPWQIEDFSGKIAYKLDSGEYFEVYREFKKKNPIIYNENKEDISKQFVIDKNKGIDFFTEQTGIDEETFYNTAINEQEGLKLSRSGQTSIIQKISNLISSGDDSISFKKSMDRLNKRQNEEVGTDRTFQRPINTVTNRINKLMDEKLSLETYKESIYDTTNQKENLEEEEKIEEVKIAFLREVKTKLDNNRVKSAEINFNKNLENEYNQKIIDLNQKIENQHGEDKYKSVNLKTHYISAIILIIALVLVLIFSSIKIISVAIIAPLIFVLYNIYINMQKKKEYEKKRSDDNTKMINEIEILKQNKEVKSNETKEKEEKLFNEIKRENEYLTNKYISKLDSGFINESLDKNYDELIKDIEIREKRLNTIKFKLQSMEKASKDLEEKIDNLAKVEEELEDLEQEKDELLSLNNSYNIAKNCLENAYNQVKENISPKFTKNLCKIISEVSDDRYKNVVINDNDGLKVEVENGNYVPVSRLSVGTIDQMYLSLRLSALSEISKETMPIILDEAFAYFDDERLKNILKYLNNNYSKNQIIILTCSKREMNLLDELDIKYNKLVI